MSDEIPKTRLAVELGEAARLRVLIRRAELVNGRIAGARLAQPADAAALAALLRQRIHVELQVMVAILLYFYTSNF